MLRYIFPALLVVSVTAPAGAHFPWLYLDDDSQPRAFFGEGPNDQDYHVPEALAAAEAWQTDLDAPNKLLEFEPYEEEGFAGLLADPVEPRGRLATSFVYGVYGGSKLCYYAQHYASVDPGDWPRAACEGLDLQAILARDAEGLSVTVHWNGEPLAGAQATLSHEESDGEDTVQATTDEQGVARFAADVILPGLNGVLVMHTDKSSKGEIEGAAYSGAMHVLTVTFNDDPETAPLAAALPRLPEALASFGAAVSGEHLYVYSGHIGTAHAHSRENLSQHFRRTRLDGEGDWEDLAMGPPLQGLALVAHGGKLYRVGGLDARNAHGEEEDLHSTDGFACYDPSADAWTDLAPLPAGRSSHNAVVIDNTLYVVGGWRLSGDDDGQWQSGALAIDLANPEGGWRELPEPPFRRRALALGHAVGRLVVLCGMTDDAEISQDIFFFDPESGVWSEGPQFPGKAYHGFGLAAWNEAGALYAGGLGGKLYRLASDLGSWEHETDFATPRFFHQLVPDGAGNLLAVAGASPKHGHTATIERLIVGQPLRTASAE